MASSRSLQVRGYSQQMSSLKQKSIPHQGIFVTQTRQACGSDLLALPGWQRMQDETSNTTEKQQQRSLLPCQDAAPAAAAVVTCAATHILRSFPLKSSSCLQTSVVGQRSSRVPPQLESLIRSSYSAKLKLAPVSIQGGEAPSALPQELDRS